MSEEMEMLKLLYQTCILKSDGGLGKFWQIEKISKNGEVFLRCLNTRECIVNFYDKITVLGDIPTEAGEYIFKISDRNTKAESTCTGRVVYTDSEKYTGYQLEIDVFNEVNIGYRLIGYKKYLAREESSNYHILKYCKISELWQKIEKK